MQRVSSAEFVRKFSAFCDEALSEPIVLTRNGRDRLLVISIDKYKQLLSLAILRGKEQSEIEEFAGDLEDLLRRTGTAGE